MAGGRQERVDPVAIVTEQIVPAKPAVVLGMAGTIKARMGATHFLMKRLKNVRTEMALSVLGITGLTAYYGMVHVGKPEAGETVVVSGAAGARHPRREVNLARQVPSSAGAGAPQPAAPGST